MNIIIHRADQRHLKDISRLIVETKIGDPMKKLKGTFWFVRIDGKIVGCQGVEILENNTAILTYLAVDTDYRKRGIGTALFNHAMRFLRTRGVTTVAFVTMYYHFNKFKKKGFKTSPRKSLPDSVRNYWMFTVKRYMKCAVMIQNFV